MNNNNNIAVVKDGLDDHVKDAANCDIKDNVDDNAVKGNADCSAKNSAEYC